MGEVVYSELRLSPELLETFSEVKEVFCQYISSYVHMLNKFIGQLRRVSTLRFERATLIKYVKKLRFFNEVLKGYEVRVDEDDKLQRIVKEIGGYYLRLLEVVDLVNFFLTQSLQNEIISKTLNRELALPQSTVDALQDTHNHFVKYTQWSLESLMIDGEMYQFEIVQFSMKCALEDNLDLEQTDNIFLQEVVPVASLEEYNELALQWLTLLSGMVATLETEYASTIAYWANASDNASKKN